VIDVDFAVVGGGITGALVADALLQAGRKVAVFDRRGLGRGSTPASTALLQFEIDTPLTELVRKVGRDRAARAWWRSAQAVPALAARVADLGLRCGFRMRPTLYLPGNLLDAAGLRREAAARERIGLRSWFIDRAAIKARTGLSQPAAIWSEGAAAVDPRRLVSGLWQSALARGAVAYAPVDIVGIDAGRRGVTLACDSGARVNARHLVLATGYETPKPIRPRWLSVHTTWAIATRPQPRAMWPTQALIWQAADPYLYLRTTPDGRIVIGGEDEEFADDARRDALLPRKTARLRRRLAGLLPDAHNDAAFAWAGCFGSSSTGLPAIGPVPGAPRVLAALGYGGNGITFSMIAAQLIQRAASGLSDPDSEIFALRD
jgi:glycine/D-amino acid oxidase-like deaminating enzyme